MSLNKQKMKVSRNKAGEVIYTFSFEENKSQTI
jgi:hypothetical protein